MSLFLTHLLFSLRPCICSEMSVRLKGLSYAVNLKMSSLLSRLHVPVCRNDVNDLLGLTDNVYVDISQSAP